MRRGVHSAAREGFGAGSALYARARPTYSMEALDHIVSLFPKTSPVVVDVGAGTGKFTKAFAAYCQLTAVEPVDEMRAKIQHDKVLKGTAEALPLEDSSVDMIVCAQAFHWFANSESLKEFQRVLPKNGVLVLIWNTFDYSVPWLQQLEDLRTPFYDASIPRQQTMQWRKVFQQNDWTPLTEWRGYYHQPASHDLVADRILSSSAVAKQDPSIQADVRSKVLDILQNSPLTRDHVDDLDLPYETLIVSSMPIVGSTTGEALIGGMFC